MNSQRNWYYCAIRNCIIYINIIWYNILIVLSFCQNQFTDLVIFLLESSRPATHRTYQKSSFSGLILAQVVHTCYYFFYLCLWIQMINTVIMICIIITTIANFHHDTLHGQISQDPFLIVVKLGLSHLYYKIRYIDCSVPKWTILRGINKSINQPTN